MKQIAIVGGSVAGISAAKGLRELGYSESITVIDADADLPHDKPPLSKAALAGDIGLDATTFHSESWYERQGIQLELGVRAAGVDPVRGQLALVTGRTLDFDGLVIATGSIPRHLPTPCNDPARIHVLRNVEDARRLREELSPGRHLAIVGGGFIGLEVAATARALDVEVTIIEAAPTVLSRVLPAELGRWFEELHLARGVNIHCAAAVQEIAIGSDGVKIRLPDTTLRADVVLVGVGAAPAVDWLAGSGIATGDGVLCDPDLSTTVPAVVAAGDVARWHNHTMSEAMRIEHWTNAVEQGRHAASTLLGERVAYRAVPYFWTNQYDTKLRFVGRTSCDDDVAIGRPKDDSRIALFGRDGVLRGAVCINSTRHLARYREAINDRIAWHDAVSTLPN